MQHVAEGGARVRDPQSESDVAQPTGVECIRVRTAPGPADIDESRAAQPKQPPDEEIREVALLEREEGAACAAW